MSIEGQGDIFEQMIPKKREPQEDLSLTDENVMRFSYLLSNVLLTILIKRGVIKESEVDSLLREAAIEYQLKRKRVK